MIKRTSTEELVAKADSGDVQASKALGLLLEMGLESKPDVKQAKKYYMISARGGDQLSQLSVADIVRTGSDGTKPDLKGAELLMKEFTPVHAPASPSRKAAGNHEGTKIDFGMKVLIVDSSEQHYKDISSFLTSANYKTLKATSGPEAIDLLKSNPDTKLILTDVTLNGFDGIKMAEKIRQIKHFEAIPIVFITAVTNAEVISKAKKAGIHGWVVKPFENEAVLKLANRWVRNIS